MAEHRRGTFDVRALYNALDHKREDLGISWRELARQADLTPSTPIRLEKGLSLNTDTLARLLLWLGETDIAPYLRSDTVPQLYLVWSNWHRAWWGPRRSGYFTDARCAGRYLLADAEDICKSRSWEVGNYAPEVIVPVPTAVRFAEPGIERELRELALAETHRIGVRKVAPVSGAADGPDEGGQRG